MSTLTPPPKVEPYPGAAGGWGALKSVQLHLRAQGIPLKGTRTLLATNQPDGFDCPGCAWPDRNHQSSFQFCENGAKAVAAEATAKRATPEVIGARTVREWAACSDFELEDQGRLTHPLVYDAACDRYRPIDWPDALALIGRELQSLASPNEALFYTSGRTSNEAAFLYQLFVREFGTNNFPDCSNMCHEPSGLALKRTIGVGKGTVTLDDFSVCDAIFSFGHNPGTNHPRMLGELREAVARGAKVVAFNPLRERGLERFADPQDKLEMLRAGAQPTSTHYFQPQVGGDLAVLKALCKFVLAWDDEAVSTGAAPGQARVLDEAFIREHTHGFEAFAADLRATQWDSLVEASGLSLEQLEEAARVYVAAKSVIICWGMGITQHRDAVATIETMAALLLMRGNIGKPGAGVCPVRGHSNVQGDRTMGIDEKPSAAFLDRLEAAFGFAPPREPGLDTVSSIQAMLDGQAKVFVGMGGNFAAATPDTEAAHRALRQCALTVHISTKFNRSHVVHGRQALVLPCLGRTEADLQVGADGTPAPQSVTVEDSMSMVHLSAGRNEPASSHLLSEPAIVAGMALATLPNSQQPWAWWVQDYRRIRDAIERVFPEFERFNERVAVPGGFRLPNGASERVWATASGKAEFHLANIHPSDTVRAQRAWAAAGKTNLVFTLSTIRSHDQYNTTIYGLNDRYRGVRGHRRVVFIHADDIASLGLKAGDWVDITSLHAEATEGSRAWAQRHAKRFLLVACDLPRGSVASYYPETNVLVPLSSTAIGVGTPTSKAIPVVLRPTA
jgi:molybdopterin-dependent oxidoreductase alpha subunit